MDADFEKDLILVTCASGKQCSHLLPHLAKKWKRLRLQVNSSSSYERLKQQYPHAEVVQVDLANRNAVDILAIGVTAIYLVGPSFHPRETDVCKNVIDGAINDGGVEHIVYSSVLNSQLSKMLNHDCKRYVEEYLMESGIPYTIMQPTHFMDTFPVAMLAKQEHPVFPAAWDPKIEFSFIALRDLGEASAKVFVERERHFYAQYPLVSAGLHSYEEVVSIAGKEIGKKIAIEKLPYEEAVGSRLKMLTGTNHPNPRTKDTAERMLLFYNRRGLVGNSNQLEWLLERKPTSYAEWVRGKLQE
ncbi:MAG: hypothetical protein M1820_008465 [Bogoriella megaspora]|nr:MAG: hypothetical protein M1820_008465 [Bogoriella megaspora]